ncbi:histidine phosphatase superfamily [Xylariaceae sp. FL0255]|nr:histidine phosphatase superfamily [Xylariaceae sp. FL0255]
MRVFFIRCAESLDNSEGIYSGSRNPRLTPRGKQQAAMLGAHLASQESINGPLEKVYTADHKRGYNTAMNMIEQYSHSLKGSPSVPCTMMSDLREREIQVSEALKTGT